MKTPLSKSRSLKLYMRELSKLPPLTAEDQERLVADRSPQARDELIRRSLRFVVTLALRYASSSPAVELEDLISAGNVGLCRAWDRFDPKRGIPFLPYAAWWIRAEIRALLNDTSRTIRLPWNQVERVRELSHLREELTSSLEHEPSLEELAQVTGWRKEDLRRALQADQEPVSLDVAANEESSTPFIESLPSPQTPAPEQAALARDLRESLHQALSTFPPSDVQLLKWRYGLDHTTVLSYKQIADKLGLTKERIRTWEKRILQDLAKNLPGLRGYLTS